MARQLEVESKRTALYLINPKDIVVDPKQNGRAFAWKASDSEVQEMAQSLRERGQLQPVRVRMIEGKRVQIVAGYRRLAAALLLNSQLKEGEDPFVLQCVIVDANEEEALVQNIAENEDRKTLSPIDRAAVMRRLREGYGRTEAEIAKLFRMSEANVINHLKLLRLDGKIQRQVHQGELAMSAALVLTEVPEEKRQEVLQQAVQATEERRGPEPTKASAPPDGQEKPPKAKVTTATEVAKAARDSGAVDRPISRRMKEVREFFEMLLGPGESVYVQRIAKGFLAYADGEIDDAGFQKILERNIKG